MSGIRCRALWLLLTCVLLAGAAGLLAQQSRELIPGETRTGALSLDAAAQVYTFDGAAGDLVSLQAEAGDGSALAILVTDAAGEMVAQAGAVAMEGVALPEAGRHYVTVLAPAGLPEGGLLDFSLDFDLQAAPDG